MSPVPLAGVAKFLGDESTLRPVPGFRPGRVAVYGQNLNFNRIADDKPLVLLSTEANMGRSLT